MRPAAVLRFCMCCGSRNNHKCTVSTWERVMINKEEITLLTDTTATQILTNEAGASVSSNAS